MRKSDSNHRNARNAFRSRSTKSYIVQIDNRGTTLVEMIVCFMLLSIFITAASIFISTMTTLYYQMKSENYSRQVADIVLEKVASEIDGAQYDSSELPIIEAEARSTNNLESDEPTSVTRMTLYDKTGTKVKVGLGDGANKNKLVVHYFSIYDENDEDPSSTTKNSREATDWTFDDSLYNGYKIVDMKFVWADNLSSVSSELSDYGLTVADSSYPDNVVVVLLHLKHPKYSDFYTYRFIKMYNVPDDYR